MKPLCIDLFAGLGGWTEGFLAEGFDVIGFDVERHVYGEHRYPAQLVLQDVCTLHGSQFRNADVIVASSPCQEFSYRAMPWKRAKALGPPEMGMHLFAQARRIQLEACAAAGRYIPMIQENVCGAQKWVGRARWHYGSYYLWGDVPALMPIVERRGVMKDGVAHRANGETNFHGSAARAKNDAVKVGGLDWNKRIPGQAFNTHAEKATKNSGGSWFNVAHNTTSGQANNGPDEIVKQGGDWFREPGISAHASRSTARKAASARIAKIPFALAQWIARCYLPQREAA